MINKVILVGRLGADPEVKYLPSGDKVANLRVATDETYVNRDGERVQKTEWHRIVCYSKVADIAEKYLTKGRLVYIDGKISQRSYEKDGTTRYVTEIIALLLKMLDAPPAAAAPPASTASASTFDEDDVPF
jgi:single-strand DNA-binding protein